MRVVISSGHGLLVRGAAEYIDEVDEARRVVDKVADFMRYLGIDCEVFHDDTSTDQDQNLNAIVDFHNAQDRDLDVSVHFNAFEVTPDPRGTEVWYVTDEARAKSVADRIAESGLINRGAKYSDGLFFLNQTTRPAILIEVCFVDSVADSELYKNSFVQICKLITEGIISDEGGSA